MDHLLIIVDYPYIAHDDAGFPIYETIPIGMINTPDCFITDFIKRHTHYSQTSKIIKLKNFIPLKKQDLLCKYYSRFRSYYLRYLKQINKMTNESERELHQSMKNKELYTFLSLKRV